MPRLLSACNTARRLFATPSVCVILVLGLSTLPAASAQARPITDGAAQAHADLPPAPALCMSVYRVIRDAIDAWEIPAPIPDPFRAAADPTSQFPPVYGAAITLRLNGQIIGRAAELSESARPEAGLLRRALRGAMSEADRRLPPAVDLLELQARSEMLRAVTISLELAGPRTPILPAPDTWADAELALAPGLDGVVAQIGDRAAAQFPAHMLSSNTPPHAALAASASRAGDDATFGVTDPSHLRSRHGAAFFRFRTAHLAQTSPLTEPIFLYRGGAIVDLNRITTAELRDASEAIFERFITLDAELARNPGVQPISAHDTRVIAAACRVFGRCVRPLTTEESRAIARLVAAPARSTAPHHAAIDSALDLVAHDPGTDLNAHRAALLAVYSPESGFSKDLPPSSVGLIALGLVEIAAAEARADPATPSRTLPLAASAVRAAFREHQDNELVSQLPWLGWAEVGLAEISTTQGGQPADVPAAVALRRLRSLVWRHQLTPLDAGSDGLDLVGGIVFTGAANPMPTWQTARPVAFLASMLRHPGLTEPAERNTELVRLLTSLRFLRQLQADDSTMWMFPNPSLARGGVRAAPWDQRMPADASALTLLAFCEALKSLDAIARSQEDPGRP